MITVFAIISILLFILAALGDVVTTNRNNGIPGLYEKNGLFRNPDGTANISKLIIVNLFVFALSLGLTAVLYYLADAGMFAFLPFLVWAIIRIPVVLGNNKKYQTWQRNKVNVQ